MKSVKVILNEDVYNLGEEGDVRDVASGYARNYLIPRGLAVPYARRYVAMFADRKQAIERRKEEKRKDALGLKERIEELHLVFEVPAGDSGKLFGSVTNAQVADRLLQEGLSIERKKIDIPGHTIKMVGEYDVTIKLYADESASLKVEIVPEGSARKSGGAVKEPAPEPTVEEAEASVAAVAEGEDVADTVAGEYQGSQESEYDATDDFGEEESDTEEE